MTGLGRSDGFREFVAWIREKYPIDPSLAALRDSLAQGLATRPDGAFKIELNQEDAEEIHDALARLSWMRMKLEHCTDRLCEVKRVRAEFRRTRRGRPNAWKAVQDLGFLDHEDELAGGRDILEMLQNYLEITTEGIPGVPMSIVDLEAQNAGMDGHIEVVTDGPLEPLEAIRRLGKFYGLEPSTVLKRLNEARSLARTQLELGGVEDLFLSELANVELPRGR